MGVAVLKIQANAGIGEAPTHFDGEIEIYWDQENPGEANLHIEFKSPISDDAYCLLTVDDIDQIDALYRYCQMVLDHARGGK